MILRLFYLFLFLTALASEAAPIPVDRLPPAGFWNPGVVGYDGTTYRKNGFFVPGITFNATNNVKDFGAVGDGNADDTTAIQNCINASPNKVVYFPPGTYKTTASLVVCNPNYPWNWSSKMLQGASPTNTFIKGYGGAGAIINAAAAGEDNSRAHNLSVTAHRGDTQITLAGWDSLYATETIGIIFYPNNMAGTPYTNSEVQGYEANARCQMVHITGADASRNVIAFDTPLYQDMTTNAEFTIFLGSDDSAIGIENLSIENAGGQNVDTIKFLGERNCWVRNCELKNAYGWHLRFQECMNCTVEGNYIHGYFPSSGVGGGGSVYGCGFYQQSTDNLCVNNHFDHVRHAMPAEYGDTGNVFAYNYNSNPINEGQENTDYLMGDELQHGVTQWNLWEGNIAADFNMDDVLGGSMNNFCFRNNLTRISHLNTTVSGWGYDIQVRNYQVSIVGTVLNNTGYSPTWRVGAPDGNGNFPGTGVPGSNTFIDPTGTPADPAPSLYLHGVLDLQSNVTVWASSNADHSLPNSLWLGVQPAFITTNYVWPATGPDVIGYTNPIPAAVNYFGNNGAAIILGTVASTAIYSLAVTSGSGSGSDPSGSTVPITAAAPPTGFQFAYWSGNVSTVANINMASTMVTMPAANITLVANYTPVTGTGSSPVSTTTNGPLAWYAFDDGSGPVAADSSGNGYTATLQNSPAWISGVIGTGALLFNGISQYVSLPKNQVTTLAGLNAATVSAWVKTTSGGTVISSGGACINYGNYALGVSGGAAMVQFVNADLASGQLTVLSTNSVSDGRWHLITGVLNGASITLYVDGVISGTRNDFSGTIFNDGGNSPVDIGATAATGTCGGPAISYFKGSIDDVRIYNRPLSSDEILSLYHAAATSLLSPPPKLFILH
jgi:hypothetical protein